MGEQVWAAAYFRASVSPFVNGIESGDVEAAATDLWRLALSNASRWVFADGLWNIWGGITDEFTHPQGDAAEGVRLASASAADLRDALGDDQRERRYCDEWTRRICG